MVFFHPGYILTHLQMISALTDIHFSHSHCTLKNTNKKEKSQDVSITIYNNELFLILISRINGGFVFVCYAFVSTSCSLTRSLVIISLHLLGMQLVN